MQRVLLVDDNVAFRQSLRGVLLRNFPHLIVDEAETGWSALEKTTGYPLIFMDVRLPDANGLDLTRRLLAQYPDLVVCVVTHFDIPEYRDAAIRYGAREYVLKDTMTETEVVRLVVSLLRDPVG
jgi:DNA-binding NarL/FixJ family response regulator